ncbi:MAG: bifunctional DNA primase/polymerase [Thermoguttaceae bacterium]|nr:bifunctional DNA primase/polymerase [Thermoguttaceae bacterium]
MSLQRTAKRYRAEGLNILPAWKKTKRPSLSNWREFQKEFYQGKFPTDAICAVCGAVSGNLEVIDFDRQAVSFDAWKQEVLSHEGFQDVFDALVIERTQSGGLHVGYRAEEIEPTQKLCMIADGDKYVSTIETRSEGSIVLIAPSDGYELIQNDWTVVPTLPTEIRDVLVNSARALTEQTIKPVLKNAPVEFKDVHKGTQREDVAVFLREDDASRRLLLNRGWTCVCDYKDGKELWRRPGKRTGVSATLDKETGLVYVWTSNAHPLDQNQTYTPLQLLAAYEFNGDESVAAKAVVRDCRNDSEPVYKCPISIVPSVDLVEPEPPEDSIANKYSSIYEVPFPENGLNPGGYLEDVLDYTDKISMRPQRRLAFGAALTALGHVLSRRIRYKYSGLTPSIYTIGISPPSSGKSSGRIATQQIFNLDPNGVSQVELIESIESVQALQSAIQCYHKCFLMQDEFGGWLTATMRESSNSNKSRIIDEVLKLFSESNNPHYVPRITAGNFKKDGSIVPVEYPSFSLYGVTNLVELQTALNERLLKNGFVARTLFIAGDAEARIRLPTYDEIQGEVDRTVPKKIELQFLNYLNFHATDPLARRTTDQFPVDIDRDAYEAVREYALERDEEYLEINEIERFDLKIFKGRSFEKTIKYALILAASRFGADEQTLKIDKFVIEQAIALSRYEHELYTFLTQTEFAETEVSRQVKTVEKWLRSLKEDAFSKTVFTRKFQHMRPLDRAEVLRTLEDSEIITSERVETENNNKKTTIYHINRSFL